jgi:hypothetical protein
VLLAGDDRGQIFRSAHAPPEQTSYSSDVSASSRRISMHKLEYSLTLFDLVGDECPAFPSFW